MTDVVNNAGEVRKAPLVSVSQTAHDVVRHIHFKRDSERTLDADVAQRMLAALDQGAEPDYRALYLKALWPDPYVGYHTASIGARDSIRSLGLLAGRPHLGNWEAYDVEFQPRGVYLGPLPDYGGRYAHWPSWDIWSVDLTGLDLEWDTVNHGARYTTESIHPDRLRLMPSTKGEQ